MWSVLCKVWSIKSIVYRVCTAPQRPVTQDETCFPARRPQNSINFTLCSFKIDVLPIGTVIRPSRGRLRTVANGCERLRTVANGCEQLRTVADGCGHKRNVRRTQLNPQTPRVKREPLLRIREKRRRRV